MSILIKDMKMPINCTRCPCSDEEARFCCAKTEYIPMLGKPDWCPLVELPEKHGRLIDGDELKTAFPTCDNSKPVLVASVRATINHMSPVIEAEGE